MLNICLGDVRHLGSASVSIKLAQGHDTAPEQIIEEADAAMYQAKKESRR